MNRKLVLLMTWVIVLIDMLVPAVSTEISVGVKEGDWIEYNLTITGTPEYTYPTWMKIEIQSIEETTVTVKLTMNMSDGTQDTQTTSANIETGSGGNVFIIPADLKDGDTFHLEYYGDITISGVETRTYVGASRTVVQATATPKEDDVPIEFSWDRSTGVLVEVSQSQVNYTMSMKTDKTNMWQAQPFGLPIDPTLLYVLIIVAIVIVATVAFFMIRRRKKLLEEISPPPASPPPLSQQVLEIT